SRRRTRSSFVGRPTRESLRNSFDFSSKQMTGSVLSYGFAYRSSTSSIRSTNSGVIFGMHHIFFPPRLDLSILETVPEGDRRDGLHFFVFDHLLLEKFKRPMIASVRRVG